MNQNCKIFIIHLERAHERKIHMEKELAKIDIPYEFVPACDWRTLSEEDIKNIYDRESGVKAIGRELMVSEVACAKSHIDVWKRIAAEKIPYALILEDDTTFLDPETLTKILAQPEKIAPYWELIFFAHGMSRVRGFGNPTWFFYRKHLYKKYAVKRPIIRGLVVGALGYLVNLRGVENLLSQVHPISMAIDFYTGRDDKLNIYCVSPPLIEEGAVGANTTLDLRNAAIEKTIKKPSNLKMFFLPLILKNQWIRMKLIKAKSFIRNADKVYNPFLKLRKYS